MAQNRGLELRINGVIRNIISWGICIWNLELLSWLTMAVQPKDHQDKRNSDCWNSELINYGSTAYGLSGSSRTQSECLQKFWVQEILIVKPGEVFLRNWFNTSVAWLFSFFSFLIIFLDYLFFSLFNQSGFQS